MGELDLIRSRTAIFGSNTDDLAGMRPELGSMVLDPDFCADMQIRQPARTLIVLVLFCGLHLGLTIVRLDDLLSPRRER